MVQFERLQPQRTGKFSREAIGRTGDLIIAATRRHWSLGVESTSISAILGIGLTRKMARKHATSPQNNNSHSQSASNTRVWTTTSTTTDKSLDVQEHGAPSEMRDTSSLSICWSTNITIKKGRPHYQQSFSSSISHPQAS